MIIGESGEEIHRPRYILLRQFLVEHNRLRIVGDFQRRLDRLLSLRGMERGEEGVSFVSFEEKFERRN
jgi:hypothetical protein